MYPHHEESNKGTLPCNWRRRWANRKLVKNTTFRFARETNFSFSPANQIVDCKPLKTCCYGKRITVFKYFHGELFMFGFFIFFWKRLWQALSSAIPNKVRSPFRATQIQITSLSWILKWTIFLVFIFSPAGQFYFVMVQNGPISPYWSSALSLGSTFRQNSGCNSKFHGVSVHFVRNVLCAFLWHFEL